MTRIHIIGGAGSGKTTLAQQLSHRLNIPCYEMDLVGWEQGVGALRPLELRLHDVHEIALQPDWVTEGGHRPWVDELLERAEQIVWLDVPWRIAGLRILTRHMRASLAGTNKHHGLLKLYRFMRGARTYYTHTSLNQGTRLAEARALDPYMHKVLRFQRPADIETFFA